MIDNFIIKLMNDYLTPRRRHSSLFQRMEDEINKISRKLSAAKQHRHAHTPAPAPTPSPAPPHPHSHSLTRAESPGLTVRRQRDEPHSQHHNSKELTKKWNGLADRTNLEQKRPPIRRLRFTHHPEDIENLLEPSLDWEAKEREGRDWREGRAEEEKRELEEQLSRMRALCEEQSFKLGFLRAENREISQQLESQRLDSFREQLYLGKLVEGYRIKIGKYKQILNEDDTVSIDIRDL